MNENMDIGNMFTLVGKYLTKKQVSNVNGAANYLHFLNKNSVLTRHIENYILRSLMMVKEDMGLTQQKTITS